ncbi:acetyltransferase [Campylobacter lanienae NCTC 13004]|uniref:Acetyltransferase n=2 Tax=Campylobacter lanienae TaxID=75658 RepID=A0A1X9SPW9_9BACT|nr:hypothetical protein [Campylobacter lanienae]ARQ98240.1 acetyltransferase [Campylobacter lanienae NCTC 13004]
MQKHIRENGNVIYGDLSKQVNLKLDFKGKNNIVFFAGGSRNVNIIFDSDDGFVFIGNNVIFAGVIKIHNNSLCFIDDNSTFNGTSIEAFEAKNIFFGRDCMFSWGIWLSTTDYHPLMDCNTNNRINFSKSIYIGDHVWCGRDVGILKDAFIATGSVIGAKSVVSKMCYSNAVNAGVINKEIKQDTFWLRNSIGNKAWNKKHTEQYSNVAINDFKYTYNQNEFLSPKAIEAKLDSLNTAQEKLEFVYDAIYMNKNKNRFAYFKDMPYDIPLPKYESKFKLLKFEEIEPAPPKPTTPQPTPQEQINSLKEEINKKDIEIKNLKLTNQKAQNIKNHLSYKLGNALIKAHKQWYKGGYIKFIFEAIKIKNEHKFKR